MTSKKDLYRKKKFYPAWIIIISSFFYCVGSTLGSGIMLMPVELATTGFYSYFLILLLPFLAEVLATLLFIEIMQKVRTHVTGEEAPVKKKGGGGPEYHEIPNNSDESDENKYKSPNKYKEHDDTSVEDKEEDKETKTDKPDIPTKPDFSGLDETSEITEQQTTQSDDIIKFSDGELKGEEEEGGEQTFEEDDDTNIAVAEEKGLLKHEEEEEESKKDEKERDLVVKSVDEKLLIKKKKEKRKKKKEEDMKELNRQVAINTSFLQSGINLHTISRSYFKVWYSGFVDFLLLLTVFPSIYVLGLSQSVLVFFSNSQADIVTHSQWLAPVFCICAFMFVFLFGKYMELILSVVSLGKSLLLVTVVLISMTLFQSFTSSTNLLFFSRPLFASGFFMSGTIFFLPNLFSLIKPSKINYLFFMLSVISALVFCQIIAVIWVIIVWGVVPQSGGKTNLQNSLENGELSNIPLTVILRNDYPNLSWIGTVINVFASISFVVIVTVWSDVMKRTLDGYVKDIGSYVSSKLWKFDINDVEGEKHKTRYYCIQYSLLFFQLLLFVSTVAFVTFATWLFYRQQYFLSEFNGLMYMCSYFFFLGGIVMVDLLLNPFGDLNIYFKYNRWVFVIVGCSLILYYVVYCTWFVVYQITKWSYKFSGSKIPF